MLRCWTMISIRFRSRKVADGYLFFYSVWFKPRPGRVRLLEASKTWSTTVLTMKTTWICCAADWVQDEIDHEITCGLSPLLPVLYIVLLVYLLKEFLTILGRGWTVPTFPRGCFPPSKAKTRLAATIGNEAACRFGLLPVFEYGISSQLQYAKFHTETTQNPFLASGWQQFEAQFAASSFI